jgi:peptidoglycan/LPS O-acetylase OafA/YrhL
MTATPVSHRDERAVRPDKAVRGGALDGLRFLAAMFIVIYHFGASAPASLEQVSPLFARGWLATDFFLILSGYVLGRAYGAGLDARRIDMPGFVGRRLSRVWPGHVVILGGFVALLVATSLVGIAPNNPERFQG